MSHVPRMPLEFTYPQAFQRLRETLGEQGLQPYDVQVDVQMQAGNECTVRVCFGEDFQQCEELLTKADALARADASVAEFFVRIAVTCHDTLKQEYRQYMKAT